MPRSVDCQRRPIVVGAIILGLWLILVSSGRTSAFLISTITTATLRHRHATTINNNKTRLFGKGSFRGGVKNKQAALAQKMELAKKQQRQTGDNDDTPKNDEVVVETSDNDNSPKEDDAHAEFAKLLAHSQPPPKSSSKDKGISFGPSAPGSNMAKYKSQQSTKTLAPKKARDTQQPAAEEEDTSAFPLQQGSQARRRDFEPLVNVTTDQPLGPVRAASLVPWVPPFVVDFLVVVADPRPHSNEWRRSVDYVQSTFRGPQDTTGRIQFLAVTAAEEPTPETRAWMTRAHMNDHDMLAVVQDATSEWMTTYGCRDGWSLHILIIDNDGIIQVHQGGVDPAQVCSIVTDAVSSLQDDNSHQHKKKQ